MRGFISTLLLAFIVSGIYGQETWDLNKCIQYAIENNPETKITGQEAEIAEAKWQQSKLNFLPSVYAGSEVGFSGGRSIDPNTNDIINNQFLNNSNSLQANMDLFNGFMRNHQIKYQKYLLQSARQSQLQQIDQLAFQVTNAYYNVLFYSEAIAVAKNQVSLSEKNIEKVSRMIESGLKSKADLLEMEATYESDKLKLLKAENMLRENRLKLYRLMNLPFGEKIEPEKELVPIPEVTLSQPVDSVFQIFRQVSPEMNRAESQVMAARQSVELARSSFFPSLSIAGALGTGYYQTSVDELGNVIPLTQQYDMNLNQYIGLSLYIPIFDRNQKRTEIKSRKLQMKVAESKLQSTEQKLYYDMQADFMKLQSCYSEYLQLGKQVESAEIAYEAAEKRYSKSLISGIELTSAKNRFSDAQNQLLLTKIQCLIQAKMLKFYQGTRFWQN